MIEQRLSDNIRQYSYNWICNHLSLVKHSKKLLDIGCRESRFPAYMASQGYEVDTVERDVSFVKLQTQYKKEFNSEFNIISTDLLDLPSEPKYNIISAIYSLQHNIEKDIECYEKAAELCTEYLYIVNEFNAKKTDFKLGRSDGDMRVYSMDDVWERIINPINKKHQSRSVKMELALFNFPRVTIEKVCDLYQANTIQIRIEF